MKRNYGFCRTHGTISAAARRGGCTPFREVHTTKCRAGADGDCDWKSCPQTRDGEPEKSGRDCPWLDIPIPPITYPGGARGKMPGWLDDLKQYAELQSITFLDGTTISMKILMDLRPRGVTREAWRKWLER